MSLDKDFQSQDPEVVAWNYDIAAWNTRKPLFSRCPRIADEEVMTALCRNFTQEL